MDKMHVVRINPEQQVGVTFRLTGEDWLTGGDWTSSNIVCTVYNRYDWFEVRQDDYARIERSWLRVVSDATRLAYQEIILECDHATADRIRALFQAALDEFDFDTVREIADPEYWCNPVGENGLPSFALGGTRYRIEPGIPITYTQQSGSWDSRRDLGLSDGFLIKKAKGGEL
jgi:hypothetical protein